LNTPRTFEISGETGDCCFDDDVDNFDEEVAVLSNGKAVFGPASGDGDVLLGKDMEPANGEPPDLVKPLGDGLDDLVVEELVEILRAEPFC